jgi:hypothetical protein
LAYLDGLLGRCHLKGVEGDAMNAVLCGGGHNLGLLLNRLRAFLRLLWASILGLGRAPTPWIVVSWAEY